MVGPVTQEWGGSGGRGSTLIQFFFPFTVPFLSKFFFGSLVAIAMVFRKSVCVSVCTYLLCLSVRTHVSKIVK